MDKLVTVIASMSAALYLLAATIAWGRWFGKSNGDSTTKTSGVILDRAVAWTGLFTLFSLVAVPGSLLETRIEYAPWFDVAIILALIGVYASGLFSVRAITLQRYGHKALIVFICFSFTAGLLALIFL